MYYDVFKFNQKRNQFKLDMELEQNMLLEEINEFFEAETLAEMLDAYIDTRYVWYGTQMKTVNNNIVIKKYFKKWIKNALKTMIDIMVDKVEILNPSINIWMLVAKSEKIVCEINNEKISKLDKNGKVMKQKNLRNATEEIAEMLKENGIEE